MTASPSFNYFVISSTPTHGGSSAMAQQMTMFGKAATTSFTATRTTKAQRSGAVAVRAGPYDAELVQTAVSISAMCLDAGEDPSPCWRLIRIPRLGESCSNPLQHPQICYLDAY